MQKEKTKKASQPQMSSLKIQSQFRRQRWSHKLVPQLRLSGNWLEQSGFIKGRA